jgi:hypothetical protein
MRAYPYSIEPDRRPIIDRLEVQQKVIMGPHLRFIENTPVPDGGIKARIFDPARPGFRTEWNLNSAIPAHIGGKSQRCAGVDVKIPFPIK